MRRMPIVVHIQNDCIPVGNYVVLYVVIGTVMEIRRFVYDPSDWRTTI